MPPLTKPLWEKKKIARKILDLTKAETRIKLHDIVSRKRSCPLWTALNYFFEEEGDQLVNAFLISNGHSELARNASLQIRKKSKSFRTETHLKKLKIIIFKSFFIAYLGNSASANFIT